MQNEASTAASKVKGIPDNSSIIIPRLVCRDPGGEIDFCEAVFEAKVLNRRPGPNGSVAHGLLTIREEMLMIETEWPQRLELGRASGKDDLLYSDLLRVSGGGKFS